MKNKILLASAISFATEAHSGQFTRDGLPYILHPLTVMNNVAMRYHNALEELLCIAILHDTLEDCPDVTETELETLFGKSIAESVVNLTKTNTITYDEYVAQILSDPFACAVKMADIEHNSLVYRGASPTKLAQYKELYTKCAHNLSYNYMWFQDRAGLL